jgi:MFS family permease
MTDAQAHAGKVKASPPVMFRWAVMVIISLAMFGNYYVYDSIAPIADILKADLGFTDENIGQLYSFYSIAAVLVLLIGGIVIDRFGTAKSTIVFGTICAIAGVLNAISAELSTMLVARVLLGIGSEPLIVAITTALAKWFKGKELSFAFGLNLTIARLGSVAADNSPSWAGFAYTGWQMPLIVAAVLGSLCVFSPIGYAAFERHAERRYQLAEAGETDKFAWGDLFRFDKSFWLVVALCATFYSAILPFRSFAIKFFIESHGMTREAAGAMNSMLPLAAMVATPIFGLLADRYGKRALMMAGASFLIMPVYLMMAYHVTPLGVPVAMMGVAYSLIPAVMWPSVAYIVPQQRLGTAYAVMTLVQQIGVAAMNWIIGRTNDAFGATAANPEGYAAGMWIFSILGVLGLIFAIALRKVETGPKAHGLETITSTSSKAA